VSYDLDLVDPVTGAVLESEEKHDLRGGTYVLGGTCALSLNVTYNYAEIARRVLPATDGREAGIRGLDGRTGEETAPLLEAAAATLGDDEEPDYWKPTAGNVRRALLDLATLARMAPKGIWRVS
jgi:hypothetical protein